MDRSMKILLAFDDSSASRAAVDEVLRRPWPEGSEVRLVTVVDPPLSTTGSAGEEIYTPMLERFRATLREKAFERIQAVRARFRSRPDLQVGYELRDGSAKLALLEAIHGWRPDLVIAGASGTGPVPNPGSVCSALVTYAPCSVEIVRAATSAT